MISKRSLLPLAIALLSFGALAATEHHHKSGEAPHWTYEGASGPSHWGDLEPAFKACKLGHAQSPIDIPAASLHAQPLDAIRFDYKSGPLHVTDNGHTVMVNVPQGSSIHVGSETYALQQFHFHHPSEEEIDGKAHPMVVHLVHKNVAGRLAVVAVLLDEGAANPALAAVFGHVPPSHKEEAPAGVVVDPSALLPANAAYFTFPGSLTTPPCTEGVTWYVLRTPMTASKDQIAAFAKRYAHNARPVQPIGGREIRASQ